jgi:hypothetical protein
MRFCCPTRQRTKNCVLLLDRLQQSYTLSVRPVLSHVNLAHHNECRETGDTRAQAKNDGITGGMSYYARNVQQTATLCKLRSA